MDKRNFNVYTNAQLSMEKTVILVVDDTPDLLSNLQETLLMEGYEVRTATHGEEALQVLHDHPVDLVITDLLMPVMDGFGLIRELKANTKLASIPIIIFSAKPQAEVREQTLALGANRFVTKPSSLDLLLTSVSELVNK